MNYKDKIKAIMFDFDGTLIDFDYSVSEYTIKAFEKLQNTDYKLCLSSGRPCYVALQGFKKTVGDFRLDYIFGCNGAEMMDVKNNKTTILYPLTADEVKDIGSIMVNDYITLGIYEDNHFLVNKPVENPVIMDWINARWLTPKLFDFSNNKIERSKVLGVIDPKDKEKVEEFISHVDLSSYSSFFSSKYCYEIVPKGIDKSKSCDVLAELLNIDLDEILAFGDMDNDIPMLLKVTGVLMGNAPDNLKDLIPLHTDKVNEKGIYTFLSENNLI